MRANEESVHDYRNWIGQGKLAIKFCDKRLHRCDFAGNVNISPFALVSCPNMLFFPTILTSQFHSIFASDDVLSISAHVFFVPNDFRCAIIA